MGQGSFQCVPPSHHPLKELRNTQCVPEDSHPATKRPNTFLCVFYDLANRFLQAVGSQHELLSRPEDLWPGRTR